MKTLTPTELQRLTPFWNALQNAPMMGDVFRDFSHELCLCEISAAYEVWHLHALRAFQQMQQQQVHDLQVYQQLLRDTELHLQSLPDQQVQLWLPSAVVCPEGTFLDACGHRFEYRTEAQVRAETQVLFKGPRPQGDGRPPAEQLTTGYWTVQVNALGTDDAWDKISHAFAMLRASFDYLFATSSRSFNSLGRVQQTHFVQPAWGYGESAGGNPRTFFFVEEKLLGQRSPVHLPEGGTDRWQALLTRLLHGSTDFQEWRQGVLSLWVSARDSFFEHDAVFGCWQTLELLTLSDDKSGKTEVITGRLKILLQDSEVFNLQPQAFLARLARIRNDLTHNRRYAPDYSALEATRYLTLVAVHWMLTLDPVFSTAWHVRQFFRLATMPNAGLTWEQQSTADVARYLQQRRGRQN